MLIGIHVEAGVIKSVSTVADDCSEELIFEMSEIPYKQGADIKIFNEDGSLFWQRNLDWICPHCNTQNSDKAWNDKTLDEFGEFIDEIGTVEAYIDHSIFICPECKKGSNMEDIKSINT